MLNYVEIKEGKLKKNLIIIIILINCKSYWF